ncbi:MAG: lactate utilization protein C [Bryobacteraceae bacterium]
MSRDHILQRVRAALGRTAGQPPAPQPPARIVIPDVPIEDRITSFLGNIEKLAGKTLRAATKDELLQYVANVCEGKDVVASNAPFLRDCGITHLPGVRTGFYDRDALRAACAVCDIGITSADFALADTGTLVMLSSPREARLISLLPPVHLAIVPRDRILTGLDELFSILPQPAEQTSSMVLITGPSRTADIEQILVRGVHGPGEIQVAVL